MKNTLGKIFLFFIFFTFHLHANEQLASYKISSNKKDVSIKEPLIITFVAKQKDHTDHMFFSFTIKKSPEYETHLLYKTRDDKQYHNSSAKFVYLLFPLKAKKLQINFDFVVKTASDKAIKQSYVDDHDDSIAISTNDVEIKLPPLSIHVKQIAQDVDLVGDFTLKSKIDKENIEQYDNVNMHYILSGTGYKNNITKLLSKNIKNVHTFSEVNDDILKLTQDGYITRKEYIYAFTSEHNFDIPQISLRVYSPKQNKFYTLTSKEHSIKVKKIDIKSLLDKVESPSSKEPIDFKTIKMFLIYLIIFFSGYLTAKLTNKELWPTKQVKKLDDIKQANSAKELLFVLMKEYKVNGIEKYISQLEMLEYSQENTPSFKDIKRNIIQELM